ncbi:MAG: hypothetical protein HY866_19050 [Chloroflexi bacterium]|nr:hypothetical protein [Chloroflexota bacterium]
MANVKTRSVRPVFLHLDQRSGWQAADQNKNVFYDPAVDGLRLGDPLLRPIPYTEPGGTFGGLTRPTGLAVGSEGRLLLADPGGNRVLMYTNFTGEFQPLWSPPVVDSSDDTCVSPVVTAPDAYTLLKPRGVAFSPVGDLVVTDTGHGRIIFYTFPGLLPRIILETGGEPWDIAFDQRSYLYVADPAARRVWRYDRLLRPDLDYAGGAGTLQRPRHLAIDANDRVYVLDDGLGQIVALTRTGRLDRTFTLADLHTTIFPLPLSIEEEAVSLRQDELPNCPALLLSGLHVDSLGRLPGVGAMIVARPIGIEYPRVGTFRTTALDSAIFNCVWHRLTLNADMPDTTSLTVRTFTADALIDDARIALLPESLWSRSLTILPGDTPEILLQSPAGRYLWLEITFGGNGRTTPVVAAMELYAPRQSSLQYLPPVFHEDPVSADFLNRFLSYFDTIFAEIETQIDDFTAYLDPDGVPTGGFLTWLGSWFDIEFLSEWDTATRREFVRRAIELHRKRGTISGLLAVLQLHTGLEAHHIIIVEHFRLRGQTESWYVAGRPLHPSPDEIAHHFTLILPNRAVPDPEALAVLERLIDQFIPAHTRYELRLVEPGIRIGCQSTIGVDMIIGQPQAEPVGSLRLGQTGQLAATSHAPRIGHVILR